MRGARVIVLAVALGVLLTGCSMPGTDSLGQSSSFAAAPTITERQHQDAQVVADLVRTDIEPLQGYSSVCENDYSGTTCLEAVDAASSAVGVTLADLKAVRIPAFMTADVNELDAVLTRTGAACGPVRADVHDRIAETYAGNEFDTAIQHVLSAAAKVEQDGV